MSLSIGWEHHRNVSVHRVRASPQCPCLLGKSIITMSMFLGWEHPRNMSKNLSGTVKKLYVHCFSDGYSDTLRDAIWERMVETNAEGCGSIPYRGRTDIFCANGAQRVLTRDLPSLTPFTVAGCGRLQLRVLHWAISVSLLQIVDNWPHKKW